MSETASAVTASASAGTSTASAPSAAPSSTPTTSQAPSQGLPQPGNASAGAPQTQGASSDPSQAQGANDFEEVSIGQTKLKLAKSEAAALKEFERGLRARVDKAAQAEKQLQQLMQADFSKFAEIRGMDFGQAAEEYLARQYEMAQMTPEQRELHALRTEREQRAHLEQSAREEIVGQLEELGISRKDLPQGWDKATPEQLSQYASMQRQAFQQAQASLQKEFQQAWAETGLPVDPFFGAKVAFEMKRHQKMHGESIARGETQPLQAAQAAAKVKADFLSHVRGITSQMDAKAIHEALGAEVIQKIRDYDIQRVTGQLPASNVPPQNRPGNQMPASEKSKEQVDQFEWRRRMGLT